jgi:hypothetical protein
MAKASPQPVVFSNPYFKILLIINSVICLLTFGAVILMALLGSDPMNKAQERQKRTQGNDGRIQRVSTGRRAWRSVGRGQLVRGFPTDRPFQGKKCFAIWAAKWLATIRTTRAKRTRE